MIRGVPHHLPNMVAVTLWHGMAWYGMAWYGMVLVWYGMVASEAGSLVFLDDVSTD